MSEAGIKQYFFFLVLNISLMWYQRSTVQGKRALLSRWEAGAGAPPSACFCLFYSASPTPKTRTLAWLESDLALLWLARRSAQRRNKGFNACREQLCSAAWDVTKKPGAAQRSGRSRPCPRAVHYQHHRPPFGAIIYK